MFHHHISLDSFVSIDADIHVAQYVIGMAGEAGYAVTPLKLQKLLYYMQAWMLVDGRVAPPLEGDFLKWRHGPVLPDVYEAFKSNGANELQPQGYDSRRVPHGLGARVSEAIILAYAPLSAPELSLRTHDEAPWQEASANGVISREAMRRFYDTQRPFRDNFPFDPRRPFVAVESNAHVAATMDLPRSMADNVRTFSSFDAYRTSLAARSKTTSGFERSLAWLGG